MIDFNEGEHRRDTWEMILQYAALALAGVGALAVLVVLGYIVGRLV